MPREGTLTIRLTGRLNDFKQANVGADGVYEDAGEYIRDLIRRDKDRAELAAFDRLKAQLTHDFAARDELYKPLTAAEVIARNQD